MILRFASTLIAAYLTISDILNVRTDRALRRRHDKGIAIIYLSSANLTGFAAMAIIEKLLVHRCRYANLWVVD